MKIYGEITKIEPQEDGTIKVVGVASTGAVDDADETVSPAAMKAALPSYMKFGALREMHGMSAAGSTLSADVGEDGVTRIETHVVDPVAVKKVQLGVYRGFSIGGRVLERDPKNRKVITKLKLNEISLVDRPCNPEAVIDMWKADHVDRIDTPTNAEVIARAIEMAAEAGKRTRHTDFVVKAREALVRERREAEGRRAVFDAAFENEFETGETLIEPALFKLGARHSAADLALLQAAHDHLAALGAQCGPACGGGLGADNEGPDGDDADDEVEDVDGAGEQMKAALGGSNYGWAEVDHLKHTVETLQKRLDDLALQPAPPKTLGGYARAVSKAEDANPGDGAALSAGELKKYLDSFPEEERGRLQLMAALRQPIALGR